MATLTVKVIEEITLNNNSYNSERSLDISSVNEIVKRIVTISTTETGLLGFATASSTDLSKSYLAGQFDEDDVRYIRITNLDSSNHLTLTFRDEDSTEFAIKVDAGHSFIYPGDNSGGVIDTMHAGGSALTVSLNDLVDIGVGRFPVSTINEANVLVDKVIEYYNFNSFGSWRNDVVFIADDGDANDGNVHMWQADSLANYVADNHKEINIQKIYLDNYVQESTPGGPRSEQAQNAINSKIDNLY